MKKTKTAVHGENKTAQLKALITPTASSLLKVRADQEGISVGELIERFARGQLDQVQEQEVREILGET